MWILQKGVFTALRCDQKGVDPTKNCGARPQQKSFAPCKKMWIFLLLTEKVRIKKKGVGKKVWILQKIAGRVPNKKMCVPRKKVLVFFWCCQKGADWRRGVDRKVWALQKIAGRVPSKKVRLLQTGVDLSASTSIRTCLGFVFVLPDFHFLGRRGFG